MCTCVYVCGVRTATDREGLLHSEVIPSLKIGTASDAIGVTDVVFDRVSSTKYL